MSENKIVGERDRAKSAGADQEKIERLRRRVKELEHQRRLDLEKIADLEGRVLNWVTLNGTAKTQPRKDALLFVIERPAWDRPFPHRGLILECYWIADGSTCNSRRPGDIWAYWTGPRPQGGLTKDQLRYWRNKRDLTRAQVSEMTGGVVTPERIEEIEREINLWKPTREEYEALAALVFGEAAS